MKLLSDIDLSNKKVGIRLDLNVPVKNGEIQSEESIEAKVAGKCVLQCHREKRLSPTI